MRSVLPQDCTAEIAFGDGRTVSSLYRMPSDAIACYALAHGAGAGMTHPFLEAVATGLSARGIATLRYQFPFMEQGSRRPDVPALAHDTVRAAIQEATRLAPSLPLFAGGKSFGGRMTSQAQAEEPLPGVRGLIFLGFPLHPIKKPSDARARHLDDIEVPMLFLQGSRDALAEMSVLAPVVERLGNRTTLAAIAEADHAFHVPARSGRTDAQVLAAMLDSFVAWIKLVLGMPNAPTDHAPV